MPLDPITWQNLTNATLNGDGDLVKTGGADLCASTGTGDAGARSTETISSGDFKFECTLGPISGDSGRTFVGLQDGTFSLDFADWQYCFYVDSEAESPYPANTVRIYEGSAQKTYVEGDWAEGDLLQIICLNGVVRYYLNSRLIYTSSAAPTYPLYAVASMACPDTSVNDAQFVSGLDLLAKSSCRPPGVSTACGSIKVDYTNAISTLVYNGYPTTYPITYALWVQLYANVPATHPGFGGINPDSLAAIISNHGGGRFFLGMQRQADGTSKLVFGGADPQAFTALSIGPTFTLGTWYHVAVTSGAGSPGARTVYVNGVEVISTTGTPAFFGAMYVGNDNSLRPLPGRLTDFKVWTKELDAGEVATEFAACYAPEAATGDVYSWSRLVGAHAIYADESGNGHTLTAGFIASSTQLPDTLAACSECAPDPTGGTVCASEIGDDTGDSCSGTWTIPTPAAFPTTPEPLYFDEIEADWGEFGGKFPDGAPRFNTIQTASIRRFVVEWGGLSKSEALALDAHFASTRGGLGFTMVHPHTAESIDNVRYESYERQPHERVWSQSRSAKLVVYVE